MKKYVTAKEFLEDLSDEKKAQVKALRDIILSTQPLLEERIKWNAPSYMLDGEDRITFNLQNREGIVKLVLHMGATRKENKKGAPIMVDTTHLIEWSSDIRGILSFRGIEDISSNRSVLTDIIHRWLEISL